ncbi:hypothetical protein P3T73_13035 [Kiritimatiellota bacterium B12222]|nr:hypothetical protein P3T73_13035 [Kiritimatiellota bacterium B12222]
MRPDKMSAIHHQLPFMVMLMLLLLCCRVGAQEAILDVERIPVKGESWIWSPLFQAAWEKINACQQGRLEKVVPPNPLITKLEDFEWDEDKVMPKDGYAVYAGPATPAFAEETAATILRDFDIRVEPNRIPVVEQGLAAYGILLRELKFKQKFFRSENRPLNFHSSTGEVKDVSFFGTAGKYSATYSDVVQVLDHQPKSGSFMLSISTEREDETLIIYRPEKPLRFQKAFEDVKLAILQPFNGTRGGATDGSLHRQDVVMIPYTSFEEETSFMSKLGGTLYYGDQEKPWRIVKAFQLTKFELFEAGARVHVETGIGMEPFGAPPTPRPVVPRRFICDAPFFVFLWKTDAEIPYLALWIDDFESLTPFLKKQ